MAAGNRRHEGPTRWMVAALIGITVVSALVIALVLIRNTSATGVVRDETERQLLLLQLESTVQIESEYAAAFAGHSDGEPAEGSTEVSLSDGPEFLAAVGLFGETAGSLRQIVTPQEQRALDTAIAAHQAFASSIVLLESPSNEEADAVYHEETQAAEAALRNSLQDMQQTSNNRLGAAAADLAEIQAMMRVSVPVLVAASLIATGYLLRFGATRRRIRLLEGLVEAKDDFISTVSHELRTPLTAVVGYADLLHEADSDLLPDERTDIVASLADQSHEVAAIVGDLLAAARVEIGGLTVASVPITLHAQVAQVLETHDRPVEVHGEAPPAIGDPARVRQVIRNLLSNADRYGGDSVTVELGGGPDFARLRVTDDGEAIVAEDRARIFESYERAHDQPGAPGSIGLGLFISRHLAQLMGGDLTYNHRGGRSIFELTLPVAAEPDASGATVVRVGRESQALLG